MTLTISEYIKQTGSNKRYLQSIIKSTKTDLLAVRYGITGWSMVGQTYLLTVDDTVFNAFVASKNKSSIINNSITP